jgi:DNA-binding MarR family transcriptional regulator
MEQVMRAVYSYLANNKHYAYSSGEIADAVALDALAVTEALDKLEEVGAIESRHVKGNLYYAHAGALPELR